MLEIAFQIFRDLISKFFWGSMPLWAPLEMYSVFGTTTEWKNSEKL
jgi:hypothetical protein